jgi:hypothetical protein
MTEAEYLAAWREQIASAPVIVDEAEADIKRLGTRAIFGVGRPHHYRHKGSASRRAIKERDRANSRRAKRRRAAAGVMFG